MVVKLKKELCNLNLVYINYKMSLSINFLKPRSLLVKSMKIDFGIQLDKKSIEKCK